MENHNVDRGPDRVATLDAALSYLKEATYPKPESWWGTTTAILETLGTAIASGGDPDDLMGFGVTTMIPVDNSVKGAVDSMAVSRLGLNDQYVWQARHQDVISGAVPIFFYYSLAQKVGLLTPVLTQWQTRYVVQRKEWSHWKSESYYTNEWYVESHGWSQIHW